MIVEKLLQTERKPWLRFYEPGIPQKINIPKKTLPQLLHENIAKYPGHTAVTFMGATLTYKELGQFINQFSHALLSSNLSSGARVAIHLPNIPQFIIAYFGAMQAGFTPVPFNPLYTEREIEHQLIDSGAEIMVTLTRYYNTIKPLKENTWLKKVVAANVKDFFPSFTRWAYTFTQEKKEGDRVKIHASDSRFHNFIGNQSSQKVSLVEDLDTTACILYTGGTTGVPKGVMLTHRNLVANTLQVGTFMPDLVRAAEKTLAVLPFFHSYGLTTCLNMSTTYAGNLILLPRFNLEAILKLIEKERPTLFPGVPTLYYAIVNSPLARKHDLTSLKACISGASALPLDTQKKFEELTGTSLVEGFGLTEAAPVTHSNPVYGYRKEGSIGIPLPNTDACIVDIGNPGQVLPPGESGELAVYGPQIMKGYYRSPEDTSLSIRNGWLLTGDIARMDEDGYFYLVDRKKEMVIYKGYNIFPREIENVLCSHVRVEEAAVAGVPDKYRGETLKAYVVLKEGVNLTEEEIVEYCKRNLAHYKVPRTIEFREELPKSTVGKILRKNLIEEEKARLQNSLQPE